jgi:hypothetical protein
MSRDIERQCRNCAGRDSKACGPRVILLIVSVLLLAIPALSQLDRGTILGTALDQSGAVIPGATVLVVNQETGRTVKLTTDSHGSFVAPELDVGRYRVSVSHTGFSTRVVENVRLHASDRINLQLRLAPGVVRQTVTVSGVGALVQTASTTFGGKILSPEITNLPLNGRLPTLRFSAIGATRTRKPGISIFSRESAKTDGWMWRMWETGAFTSWIRWTLIASFPVRAPGLILSWARSRTSITVPSEITTRCK